LVARIERSEIRDGHCSFSIVPGFSLALNPGHGDGKTRAHARRENAACCPITSPRARREGADGRAALMNDE
jgi:hypothetical protein